MPDLARLVRFGSHTTFGVGRQGLSAAFRFLRFPLLLPLSPVFTSVCRDILSDLDKIARSGGCISGLPHFYLIFQISAFSHNARCGTLPSARTGRCSGRTPQPLVPGRSCQCLPPKHIVSLAARSGSGSCLLHSHDAIAPPAGPVSAKHGGLSGRVPAKTCRSIRSAASTCSTAQAGGNWPTWATTDLRAIARAQTEGLGPNEPEKLLAFTAPVVESGAPLEPRGRSAGRPTYHAGSPPPRQLPRAGRLPRRPAGAFYWSAR